MTIHIEAISKSFGDQLVVSDVSLTVEDSELFVLLGSSGSGKSTLLRIIAGLTYPDAGRIELHGKDVTALPPQARGTGFVFQNYAVFKHMTVSQNIEFGLKIRKVEVSERKARRERLLDLVGLTGLGDRYPAQLSGGQRQRVALARALAYEPAVLLLDEPFGALDARIRSQLRRSLKEIQRELKVATILVTHDQEEAFELGDRIGILGRGHLVEVGRPEQLYHRPRSEYTAAFLGGGNVVVGRYQNGKVKLGDVELAAAEDAPKHEEGAPVRILFRPETVQVSREPFAQNAALQVLGRGRIVESSFMGGTEKQRIELRAVRGVRPLKPFSTYGQPFLTIEATRPSHNSNDADKLQVGEEVWLGLASFHVLDPTGLRMLAWTQAPADEKAVFKAAKELLQASHGRASILSVTQDSEKLAKRKDELEKCCAAAEMTPDLGWAVKAKAGEMDTEVFKELQKESYELVIAQGSALDSPEHEQVLERVVMEFGVSLLLTGEIDQHISEILICTAAGEPGKEDVYFGGRIARHTRSITTVLHVFDPERGEAARKRAERHLDKAKDLLNAFNVESVVKMEHGRFLPVLWNELKKKGYQLVVMGVPWKASGRHLEIASNLIKQTKASLLLVPAGRG